MLIAQNPKDDLVGFLMNAEMDGEPLTDQHIGGTIALLHAAHQTEWAALRQHATRLADYRALESPRQYPLQVRKLLRRLNRTRLDRLVNQLL